MLSKRKKTSKVNKKYLEVKGFANEIDKRKCKLEKNDSFFLKLKTKKNQNTIIS